MGMRASGQWLRREPPSTVLNDREAVMRMPSHPLAKTRAESSCQGREEGWGGRVGHGAARLRPAALMDV